MGSKHTILEFLSPTLPDLLGRITFTNNGVFLAVQASNNPGEKAGQFSNWRANDAGRNRWVWVWGQRWEGETYAGLVSSHFFLRRLQVIQPVLERPLVIFT